MLTAIDIRYDPATHTSTTPDGRPVPHVTSVLTAAGLSEDFDEIMAIGARQRANVETGRARGTAAHADCHAFDDDDIVWSTVDDRVLPYVDAWRCFREDKGLTPIIHGRERRIYHPVFHYTGILDGVFDLGLARGRQNILVDIKTGDPKSAAADLQTAAYAAAWDYEYPHNAIDERWAVWLRPGLKVPYQVTNYSALPDAETHFGTFCACLTVYSQQVKRGRRIP